MLSSYQFYPYRFGYTRAPVQKVVQSVLKPSIISRHDTIYLMKQKLGILVVIIFLVAGTSVVLWNHLDYSSATRHDTNRWAVIRDVEGSLLAIETTDDAVWNQLVQLHQNGTEMWIGGAVERYDNKWGFRFNPETFIIAQFTIEGAQTTIRFLSEDIKYWINFGIAYIGSTVIELHS